DGRRADRSRRAPDSRARGPRARGHARPGRARRLATLEVRLALLGEGLEALLRVLGGEREVERATLVLEAQGERRLVRSVDRFLREPGRDRALRGDVARDPLRLLEPGFVRDAPGHHASGERLSRAQEPAA